MNIKIIATVCSVLALGACGNDAQNPEKLKGANFIAKSGNTQITLAFAPDEMRVSGQVVNLYNASYTADGDNIKFGDMLSTMMMGPKDAMNVEYDYFKFMETVEKYNLNNGTLTLRGADGREMTFTQVETLPDPELVMQEETETETVVAE